MDRAPNYLWDNFFFGNLLITFRLYYDRKYMAHFATVRSTFSADVSDVLRNFLYESSCRKHTYLIFFRFFLLFVFEIFFLNHHFLISEKIHTNLIKYIKSF